MCIRDSCVPVPPLPLTHPSPFIAKERVHCKPLAAEGNYSLHCLLYSKLVFVERLQTFFSATGYTEAVRGLVYIFSFCKLTGRLHRVEKKLVASEGKIKQSLHFSQQ